MSLNYIFLTFAIFTTAFGQFFYKKYSLSHNYKYFYLTIILFIVTPIFSYMALKKLPIDIVYMFTSLTILLVLLLSKIFLNEKIAPKTYIGVVFIILGVILYGT